MVGLGLAIFIGLYAFGYEVLGWDPDNTQIQFGLFVAFVMGILCGYKARS